VCVCVCVQSPVSEGVCAYMYNNDLYVVMLLEMLINLHLRIISP